MNILDENVPDSQRRLLRWKRIHVRQSGCELGHKGMKDREIIPLLHTLDHPTFFTFDADFWRKRLCHTGFCLVWLDVEEDEAAAFIRRTLSHPVLKTRAKRMGAVVHVAPTDFALWRVRLATPERYTWKRA